MADRTASLMGLDSGGDTLDAFLSNTIGSTATTLLEATGITVSSGSFSTVTLFSGIGLLANTDYYLTIAPETNSNAQWAVDATFDSSNSTFSQPAMVLDSGVSFLSPPGFCTDDGSNCNDPAPTSGFGDAGLIPIFSVETDPSAVPEPSTGILAAAGLAAVALLTRRKRRA